MSTVFNMEPPTGNVVCPNCRAVVVAAAHCSNCNAPLPFQTGRATLISTLDVPFNFPDDLMRSSGVLESVRTSVTMPLESVTATDVNISAEMDPRLQRLVLRAKQGIRKLPTSSTGEGEAAVVAKVSDVAAWESLSEVRMGAVIDSTGDDDGTTLVTARIPVERLESVRAQPFVKSLKAGQRVIPTLDSTISEIGSRADLLPNNHQCDGGRGTIVGIIDFGCDYLHENFRNADGSSRILALWDQTGPTGAASPFGYGKAYTKAEIDAALAQPNPYAALGYEPPPDSPSSIGAHGTHVTDIAAGNGRGSTLPGVAPNADIVFVEVSASDVPWSGPQAVGKSFGDSVQLLEAVRFIFDFAGNRPCAINISLGTNGGPHDGTTLVEQGIDRLIRQAPNRAVAISASNSFSDGIFARGTVPTGGYIDLVWDIPSNDSTNNELEIWYAGEDRFALEVIAPNGASLITVNPGENKTLSSGNRVVLLAANRLDDPNNHDNMIGVFLEQGLPVGRWTMRLHGSTVQNGGFHAWIERDDSGQSNFLPPNDNSHTLGSVSCGQLTVAVGSYDGHKASLPLSYFSSAGPTRDGRQKPEVSAPGHNVLAAHSRTRTRTIRKSGTSMAAPAVTGVLALMLAEARARGLSLTATQIRDILINSVRRNPPPGNAWDSRFGHGRVSASAAVAEVIALAPAPPPPVPPAPPVTAESAGKKAASKKGGVKGATLAAKKPASSKKAAAKSSASRKRGSKGSSSAKGSKKSR